MTEEQRQMVTELVRKKVKECGVLCERFDVTGTAKDHEFWMKQYLKYDCILAALTQPAGASENIRHDALCDTNYARGVAHGWNLAQNGDSEGMRKCIESRTTAAMSALAQPVSPALKLPTEASMADFYENVEAGNRSEPDEAGIAMWNACLAEVKRLNAPHTAPIEPICATGGAEWVKVGEQMPEECEPVIVADHGIDVYPAVFSDGKFYEYGDTFTPCLMSNPTHWMPLPAAPNGKT